MVLFCGFFFGLTSSVVGDFFGFRLGLPLKLIYRGSLCGRVASLSGILAYGARVVILLFGLCVGMGRNFVVSYRSTVKIFSSKLNKLDTMGRFLRILPGRGVVCFKSAKEMPCNGEDHRAVSGCTLRSTGFLLGRGIGAIITTYNAMDSITNSVLRRGLSIPCANIMGPATFVTSQGAGGNGVKVVNATTAVSDRDCGLHLRGLGPGCGICRRTYPLFIPLIRGNFVYHSSRVMQLIVEECLSRLGRANISALVLNYARCPLLHSTVTSFVNSNIALISSKCRATVCYSGVLERGGLLGASNIRRAPRFCMDSAPSKFGDITKLFLNEGVRRAIARVSVRRCWQKGV